jgi:hypothetical protein
MEYDSKGKLARILGVSTEITNVKEKELTIMNTA